MSNARYKQTLFRATSVLILTSQLIVSCAGGLPQEAERALNEAGYNLESSTKAEYPENYSDGRTSGFDEAWCTFATIIRDGATHYDGIILARKGNLWSAYPIPLGYAMEEEEKTFKLVGCSYDPPPFRSIINNV